MFKEYFIPLTSFARKYTGDLDDAKDIVHQVFMQVWEKKETIHADGSIRSYLFTAVYNRSMNYIRDKKKFADNDVPQSEASLGSYIDSRDQLESEETQKEIYDALNALPEACRKIFIMSRFEEKKYREIADDLQISIKTVETQMSKALKILREKLVKYIAAIVLIVTLLNKFWP